MTCSCSCGKCPMILYFNPDCSKCNEAKSLLENQHCDFEIRNYLQQPPSVDEIKDLVKLLGCALVDLVRTNEPLFQEKFSQENLSDDQVIRILSENPQLIQRPILIGNGEAVIGRPPQLVLKLVK